MVVDVRDSFGVVANVSGVFGLAPVADWQSGELGWSVWVNAVSNRNSFELGDPEWGLNYVYGHGLWIRVEFAGHEYVRVSPRM